MILFYFLCSPGKRGVRVTLRFHCASIYALAMTVKNPFFLLPFLRAVTGNRPTLFFSCAEFSSNPLWLLNPENFEIGIRNSMGGGRLLFHFGLKFGNVKCSPFSSSSFPSLSCSHSFPSSFLPFASSFFKE